MILLAARRRSKDFHPRALHHELNPLVERPYAGGLAMPAICVSMSGGRGCGCRIETNGEDRMYTLYSMQRSGNCYKVRLALAKLGIRYRLVEVDILKGETRTPEFLAKNPSGHVPLLEVAPRRYLPESNAILWYIAGGSPLAPDDRIDRAEVL
jgi:Glutathione S-transferase, N-terminal domain